MPDTKDLVNQIKDNNVELLKINEQIAYSISKPIGLHLGKTHFINNIGNNRLAIIYSPSSSQMLISIFDLSTKRILNNYLLNFKNATSITSCVPLDNTNYIAIGDWWGQLLILDVNQMKIIATHQIARQIAINDHVQVLVRKHNGRLYGATGDGKVFFSAPAISTLIPKIIKIDPVVPHDVAMDAAGYAYFSGGKFADLTSDGLHHDNPPLSDLGNSLHLGSKMKLIQQETGDSYLAIINNEGSENNGIYIFKGGPAPQGIMRSQVHARHTFLSEIITHMEILSEKDKLLVITTNKSTHIYDLQQNKVITSFEPMPDLRVVADGILFFEKNGEVSIFSTHQLQKPNALAKVVHALQHNRTLSQIIINEGVDGASLQTLMKRPGVRIEIPSAQKLIDQLSEIIQFQNRTLIPLTEERASLQKELDTRNREAKEMQSHYEQKIMKLNAILSISKSFKSLTEKINETKETISPELLEELVSDETNLCTISLIRFSEQKELNQYEEVLKTKRAILSVADLKMQISTASSHKDLQKNNLLVQAVQQLILDYVEGRLPQQVLESLEELIIPEIKEAINKGEPAWLASLNLTCIKDMKMRLKKGFFTSAPQEENASLDRLFDEVVTELGKSPEYSSYLEDRTLFLALMRAGNSKDPVFKQLVETIKELLIFNKIDLTPAQQAKAFQSLLANQKSEMVQFIHNKIVQYWENEKQTLLNPDAAEINHLKAENAALKQRLSNTTQGAGTSDAAFFAQDTNANTQVANTTTVEPYEIFG